MHLNSVGTSYYFLLEPYGLILQVKKQGSEGFCLMCGGPYLLSWSQQPKGCHLPRLDAFRVHFYFTCLV